MTEITVFRDRLPWCERAVQLQLLKLLELVVPVLLNLPGDFTRWDQVGLLEEDCRVSRWASSDL